MYVFSNVTELSKSARGVATSSIVWVFRLPQRSEEASKTTSGSDAAAAAAAVI